MGLSPRAVLTGGELTILGRIPAASNATLVCDAVLDDETARCVYKPVRGEVPLWDFPDGTLAGREVASFLISEALGWEVIPTTVSRDGPLGPGMVQRWVDTPDPDAFPARMDLVDLCPPGTAPAGYRAILRALDGRGDLVELVHADDPRLLRMAVLDVVLNNADRKGGHVLEGVDGGVYGVDHGICLHTDNKLRTVLWGWAGEAIPGHLVADVEALVDTLSSASAPLRGELAEHITRAEIEALVARATTVVTDPHMPLPPGHHPIPWPPF
ncbi:MAG: SCO1664 family protein [Gordonia sp. (in: high G+C Gram-positive bacteria)]